MFRRNQILFALISTAYKGKTDAAVGAFAVDACNFIITCHDVMT